MKIKAAVVTAASFSPIFLTTLPQDIGFLCALYGVTMLEATAFEISTAEDCSLNFEISKIRHSRTIELESVKRIFLNSNGKLPKAERIASELCLSVRTFNRYLKNSGVSYRELQEEVRKQKASEFLLQTDKSIKSISETMGYANPSNFTKAFKAWFGMTPKEFRRSHRVF